MNVMPVSMMNTTNTQLRASNKQARPSFGLKVTIPNDIETLEIFKALLKDAPTGTMEECSKTLHEGIAKIGGKYKDFLSFVIRTSTSKDSDMHAPNDFYAHFEHPELRPGQCVEKIHMPLSKGLDGIKDFLKDLAYVAKFPCQSIERKNAEYNGNVAAREIMSKLV